MDLAIRHIEAKGIEGLSLRALARELGVSHMAPYRHFKNRLAMLAALATEGFRELESCMESDPARIRARPLALLFESALSYIDYACRNQVKYHLMFGDVICDFSRFEHLRAAADSCYLSLENLIQAGVDERQLIKAPVRELAATAWSMVHGISLMIMNYRYKNAASVATTTMLMPPPAEARRHLSEAPQKAVVRLLGGMALDKTALATIEAQAGLSH